MRLEEGRDTNEGAAVKPKAPPELLEEMFEIQEALQEARAGRRSSTRPRARRSPASATGCGRATATRRRGCAGRSARPGTRAARRTRGPALLAAFKEALATRAYLEP